MSSGDAGNGERARRLMMAALDGEIAPEEQRELDRLLAGDDELRREWESMSRVKEVTHTMSFREPPEEVWGRYWGSVYNRIERGIGWILVSLGSVVVLGWAAWQALQALLAESDLPVFIRVGILAAAVGTLILLVSVIREKWFTRRHDPYKEVER